MSRPLTFREVIDVLLGQGATVLCYRCGKPILIGKDAEREHLVEKALGGDDSAANAGISHKACHAAITRGTGATTAGSSIGRISKAKRIAREAKFVVNKPQPGTAMPVHTGRNLPSRRIQGRSFPPRGSRPMSRKVAT